MNIKVSYEEMQQVANSLKQHAENYHLNYSKFYEDIREINKVWQGSDHDAYLHSIESFEENFKRMKDLLFQIGEFVESASNSYKLAQDEIRQYAQSLNIR